MKTLKDKELHYTELEEHNDYFFFSKKDVKEAVLRLINEIDNIRSDDFNHDCYPNYEDVLELVIKKIKEIFGDFKEK